MADNGGDRGYQAPPVATRLEKYIASIEVSPLGLQDRGKVPLYPNFTLIPSATVGSNILYIYIPLDRRLAGSIFMP